MKHTNKKGFTIVELVIVIAVIAILAAVLIPTFSGVVAKANASAAQQLAMTGVKSGLLMTNTATLPEDTFILINSSKNASNNPDYGYVYTGNALGDPVELYKGENKTFDYALTNKATTLLINNEVFEFTPTMDAETGAITGYTFNDQNGASKWAALVLKMVNVAYGKELTTAAVSYDGSAINIHLADAVGTEGDADYVPAKNLTVYTSPDMPANVVVFVPMG